MSGAEQPRKPSRAGGWVVNVLLAAAVLLCALIVIPAVLGFHRYVIDGGSMEPAIPYGSMAYAREVPVEELVVGDVITFQPPPEFPVEQPVTHRIVEIEETPSGRTFRTQGDANAAPDPWTMTLDSPTQPRVEFHLAYVGIHLHRTLDLVGALPPHHRARGRSGRLDRRRALAGGRPRGGPRESAARGGRNERPVTRRRCVAAAVAAAACLAAAAAHGAFTSTRTNPQTLTSVPDFLPPVAARAQAVGDVPGIVNPGRQYRVYAQVADQGNPPAGVQTVKADVTSLGGPAALSLAAGSFTAGGISYNYGSSAQTAPAGVTTGPTRPYSLTMTDALAQSSTQSFTVSVQPGCVPVAIDAVNGSGGRVRAVDRRDVIRYTYSAALKSTSLSRLGDHGPRRDLSRSHRHRPPLSGRRRRRHCPAAARQYADAAGRDRHEGELRRHERQGVQRHDRAAHGEHSRRGRRGHPDPVERTHTASGRTDSDDLDSRRRRLRLARRPVRNDGGHAAEREEQLLAPPDAPPTIRFQPASRGKPAVLMILPRKLLGLIYVAIGVFVAYSKDYLDNVETLKRVVSAGLAILLWPLLLLGIDLHIR